MTIKNSFQIFTATVLAIGLQSCGDFLDKLPDDRTEIDSVDKVQQLLKTAYPQVNFAWLCELSSDNLLDNQTPHLPSSPSKKQVVTYYNYASYERWDDELFHFDLASMATYSDTDAPGSLWSGYYSSIASCNYALQTLDELQAKGETVNDRFRALRAEAKILRAYSHFCLVNIFSQAYSTDADNAQNVGVPYVTEPETTMMKHYERGTVAETYRMIKQDLEEALPDISDSYMGSVKYHFNTQAAHAFAARFYLYTRDWNKVIEHANEVLGTDSASVERVMMDWSGFDDAVYMDDYAKIWQGPDQASNLMLISSYSLLMRHGYGNRYSMAGEKCQDVLLYSSNGLSKGIYGNPQLFVGAYLFGSSTHDYGYYPSKVGEEFEYTDKLAGIGYCHIIQRAFTTASLLLERAEAELMLGQVKKCSDDICLYWNSAYNHFSDKNKEEFKNYVLHLDDATILKKYTQTSEMTVDGNGLPMEKRKVSNRNCYTTDEWNTFAGNVDNLYGVNDLTMPYMNCLNEMRRFENCYEGHRFFDLKRWGMTWEHKQGSEGEVIRMEGKDVRRAIDVPWEAMASGLESSRPTQAAPQTRSLVIDRVTRIPDGE